MKIDSNRLVDVDAWVSLRCAPVVSLQLQYNTPCLANARLSKRAFIT